MNNKNGKLSVNRDERQTNDGQSIHLINRKNHRTSCHLWIQYSDDMLMKMDRQSREHEGAQLFTQS